MLLGSEGSDNAISRPEKKGHSSVTVYRKAIPSCGGLLFAGFNFRGLRTNMAVHYLSFLISSIQLG